MCEYTGAPACEPATRPHTKTQLHNSKMNPVLQVHFRATGGQNGMGKGRHGVHGEDILVRVPPGTVVRMDGTDELIGVSIIVVYSLCGVVSSSI